jgi:hypothetical protein
LVPLLVKGLRERAAVARKTGLIIHNMVKVRLRTHQRSLLMNPSADASKEVALFPWGCRSDV